MSSPSCGVPAHDHQVGGLVSSQLHSLRSAGKAGRDDPDDGSGAASRSFGVRLLGRARAVAPVLRCAEGGGELVVDDGAGPSPDAAPDAVVVWLEDGDEDPVARRRLLATGLAALPPGGHLLLVGSVVSGPGGTNPGLGALLDEVVIVAGAMIHVDDVVAVQWEGETLVRGVLLVASSLAGREEW